MKHFLTGAAAIAVASLCAQPMPAAAGPVLADFSLVAPTPPDSGAWHKELNLPNGTYSVGVRGAWNAWFYDEEFVTPGYVGQHSTCDLAGCSKGWLNIFRVQVGGDPHQDPTSTDGFYWDPISLDFTKAVFATPGEAEAVESWHTFEVTDPSAIVSFSIYDIPELWFDNAGGLSVTVVEGVRTGLIPEPGTLSLVACALMLLAVQRRLGTGRA
jgi:hypothetical protein